jgi:hypothetical protein
LADEAGMNMMIARLVMLGFDCLGNVVQVALNQHAKILMLQIAGRHLV